ncbi:MAG TPA: hypothetical protein VLX92_20865 [Kofleriaceae bacterium]|nr:hypothetical protein [Kofleriaceae bacterium]
MKQIKTLLATAGLLGIISFFLPYIKEGDLSLSFWDFHTMPKSPMMGLLNGPSQVWVALVGFLIPLLLGTYGVLNKRLPRWAAIVGGVGFLLAFATEGVRKGMFGDHGMSTAIGGKVLFLSALVGLGYALIGAVKPERA